MTEASYELSNPAYRDALDGFLDNPQVMIEITNICNFACTYCTSPQKPRAKAMMRPELFHHIARQLPSLTTKPVRLHIDGEPTSHPRFLEYARAVNENGLPVGLATNGSLLKPEYLSLWADLLISISTSPQELARRHPKLDFDKYLEQIVEYMAAWGRGKARQSIWFQVIYYRWRGQPGFDQYEAAKNAFIADFIRRAGLDEHCAVVDPIAAPVPRLRRTGEQPALVTFLREVVSGGGLYPVDGKLVGGQKADRGFCDSPWKRLTIQSDGTVSCCCVDLSGGTAFAEPDDIWNLPLSDIWKKHAGIRALRGAFLDGNVEREVCKTCLGHANAQTRYVAPFDFPLPA